MKISSSVIFTLSPVRRVAAFFTLLGILTLTSCGEKKKTHVTLLDEQAVIVTKLHDVLKNYSKDPNESAEKFLSLIDQLKELKKETSALGDPTPEEVDALANHTAYTEAYQNLMKDRYQLDPKASGTAEIIAMLQSLHDPSPLQGEGKSE